MDIFSFLVSKYWYLAVELLCYTVKVKSLSRVRLFVTPWTVAYQAPLSMRFSRQECWSRLPFPSPGDLPNPGTEPGSPTLKGRCFTIWATREVLNLWYNYFGRLESGKEGGDGVDAYLQQKVHRKFVLLRNHHAAVYVHNLVIRK